jgi:hypothetical protein
VLNIRIAGAATGADLSVLSVARLRTFVPQSMNLEIRLGDGWNRTRHSLPLRSINADTNVQLELGGG